MTEQVEGDVPESHVLLELGGTGHPSAEVLREDHRVVTEAHRVRGDIGVGGAVLSPGQLRGEVEGVERDVAVHVAVGRGAHRCGTPSDAV